MMIVFKKKFRFSCLKQAGKGLKPIFPLNSDEMQKEILKKALNNKFSPEFLNRIDEIIIFNKLTKEDIFYILNNECEELKNNLFEVGEYDFKISKAAKEIIINSIIFEYKLNSFKIDQT